MIEEEKRHAVTVMNYYDDRPSVVMNSITGQRFGNLIRLDIYDSETDVEITLGEFDLEEIKEMIKRLDY